MTQLWPAEIELAYMDAQVCKASARGICPNSLSGAYSRYFPRAPITLVVLDSPFENPLTLASILRVVNSQQGRSIAAQDPTATQLCRPMRGLLITIPKVPTLPAHHSVITDSASARGRLCHFRRVIFYQCLHSAIILRRLIVIIQERKTQPTCQPYNKAEILGTGSQQCDTVLYRSTRD